MTSLFDSIKLGGMVGFDRKRSLPKFQKPFQSQSSNPDDADVLLFADTFNRYFDPETLRAAERVIARTGKTVGVVSAPGSALCCGRTYLSAGKVDQAIKEMTRTTDAFRKALDAGKMIVGLEPSCTLMFRDEAVNLIPNWTAAHGAKRVSGPLSQVDCSVRSTRAQCTSGVSAYWVSCFPD